MELDYNITNFNENGMAWPFKLSKDYDNLEEKYFEFQENAQKYLGHSVTLKPNLLSTFFFMVAKICYKC